MADIKITATVPEKDTAETLAAFNVIAGCHMTLEARGHGNPETEFDGRHDFTIKAKDDKETDEAFCGRVLKELGKAVISMAGQKIKDDKYRAEVKTIVRETYTISEELLK